MKNVVLSSCVVAALASTAIAQSKEKPWQHDDGTVEFQGQVFESWQDFHRSDLWDPGAKCLTPDPIVVPGDGEDPMGFAGISPSDCTLGSTSINAAYDPEVAVYRIPCVVHVITID